MRIRTIILPVLLLYLHSPGSLSLEDTSLKEIERWKLTYASTTGAGDCLKAAVVYIRPENLVRLLNSNYDFKSGHESITNQTFFETFHRFLVPFGDNGKEHDPTRMRHLLNLVAQYNKNQSQPDINSNAIELWIAIIPTSNITSNLNEISEIIRNVNAKHNGTVSTLLFNYRSLQLAAEYLPLLLEEIGILVNVTSLKFQGNLKAGIILERYNCDSVVTLILTQALRPDDEMVFLSQLYSDIEIPTRHLTTFRCTRLRGIAMMKFVSGTSAKSSAEVTAKISISFKNHTFIFRHPKPDEILRFCSATTKQENYTSNVFKVDMVGQAHEFGSVQGLKNVDEMWLRQDTILDKNRIGVLMHPPADQHVMLPSLTPKLFGTFRKIIVEADDSDDISANKTRNFVQFLARYKADVVRHGTSQLFDDNIPVKMMIVANIHKDENATRNSILNAWNVSEAATGQFPGIVTAVVLRLTVCENMCEFSLGTVAASAEETLSAKVRIVNLPSILKYACEARDAIFPMDAPKIGVIWDLQTCEIVLPTIKGFLRAQHPQIFADLRASFSKIDFFVYKVVIHTEDLMQNGAERTLAFIVQTCLDCQVSMFTFYERQPIPTYIVKLVGCNGKPSTLKESIEIGKFYELVNSWSIKARQNVIIDTALQYKKYETDDAIDCSKNSTNLSKSACHCGWWHVTKTLKANNSFDFKFETRKEIAAKLLASLYHGNLNDTSHENSKKQLAVPISIFQSVVLATLVIFAVAIVVLTSVCVLRYRSKLLLSKEEMKRFRKGNKATFGSENKMITLDASGRAESQPYNKEKYEVAHSLFKTDLTRRLGSGAFGIVYHGSIKRNGVQVQVAVKTVKKCGKDKSHGHYLALKGLLSEIKILSFIGDHPHIIGLLGANTGKMQKGMVLVFLEFCEYGSLDKYLRQVPHEQAKEMNIRSSAGMLENTNVLRGFPNRINEMSQDLLRWSVEIANGMEFLASKKIVHADLSTRNILLNSEKTSKISDFGLSRRLYDYSEYFKTDPEPLPWRWMAPESLRRMLFNEKTDVWSFGVTLWEMFNFGDEPYPGLTWDVNFPALLERGLRLAKPRHNLGDIYSVMKRCWESVPDRRPTFVELQLILQK